MGIASRSITVDDIMGAISQKFPILTWNLLDNSYKVKAGVWAISDDANFWIGAYLQNTSDAQNDEVGIGHFYIPVAGTYTLNILHRTGPGLGKQHFLINGSDVANIDCYSAGAVTNVNSTVSLGTLTVGHKQISIKISDKNGSATGYLTAIQSIVIYKA